MGADLTYNCLGNDQYRIRLSFYRDCAGITPSTSAFINVTSASCGQTLSLTLNQLAGYPVEVSPLCAAQLPNSTCNGGTLPGVQQYVYEGTITLPMQCTDWVFGFSECCRNVATTTLTNPGSENLYIQATLNNLVASCNNSPDFTTLPVPYICNGQNYIYNHGAVDIDGDSLVYTLVNALTAAGTSVTYNGGFSGTNPINSAPPTTINSANGNVTMTPTGTQTAVVAVRVDEYRNGVLIGSAIRDIQVTVLNCSNNTPAINPLAGVVGGTQTGPFSIEICPGQNLSFSIPGTDPDAGQLITWSWNNGIPGGAFVGPTGLSPQNALFSWTPTGADVGLNSLTVTIADNACPVLGQQTRAIDIVVLQGTTVGPDQVYCTGGGPVPLTALGGSAFTWTTISGDPGGLSCTNCANPNASPSMTSVYAVQSNLPGPCVNRDTIQITVAPSFTLTMGPPQTVCQGGGATLSATPNPGGSYTYVWAPSGSLSSATVQSPTATPTSTTTYNVSVTSAAGCEITGSQSVTVSNAILTVAPTATPVQSCAGAPVTLNANVGSGDCNQYTVANIPFAPVASAGTALALSDDQVSGGIPIGFNFTFFCNTYSTIYISSNGFLTFNAASGSGCCGGQLLPDALDPNDVIAVAWDDLYPPGAGSVDYQTLGVAPNRRFVVTYSGIPFCCGSTPAVTAQAILYETTNVIEIHSTSVASAAPGTQGIESSTGAQAFTVAGRNSTTWSATNDAYSFTPVPPTAFTLNWQSPLGTTVATGTSTSVAPPSTTTYYAVASNGICSATAPVTVDVASVSVGPDVNICPAGQNVNLNAVYSGPPPPSNCNSYTAAAIPFSPVGGSGTIVSLSDDQVSGAIPIGFSFTFFCNSYTNVHISSNGFITFNAASGSGCCGGQLLPNAADPNNLIAAAWDDLYPPGAGSVDYQTLGAAPNRRFVVTYSGVPYCCGSTPEVTAQIILFETSNIIEVHSTSVNNISPGTEGIEDAAGTVAFTATGRNSSTWSASNDAWRFSPQVGAITYSWSPATNLTSTTISNPTAVNVASQITYTVTVNNGTCVLTDDMTVTICLPVESVQLRAEAEGDDVRLDWDVVDEVNLARYDIERSTDGLEWVKIGEKAPIGQPGQALAYRSYDPDPVSGTNIYRLRIVDLNGEMAFSNQAEVLFAGEDWMRVTPNPGDGLFNFEVHLAQGGKMDLEIFSADGKSVHAVQRELNTAGKVSEQVDLRKLPAGNYLYRIQTKNGTMNGRLIRVD